MELDLSVSKKFDAILDRVKETQSELSLAELGLVKKLSYFEKDKTIVAYMNFAVPNPSTCPACFIATDMMKDTVERDLKNAILLDFPGWNVRFA